MNKSILKKSLILATALLSSAAFQAKAADSITLILDWVPTGDYAPYYAGIQNGIYKKYGIDLKINRSNGSGDAIIKVAGGAADIGMADISAVFTARQRAKTPVKTIASIFTNSAHSMFVLDTSGIKSFKDLEGKKIGISAGNSHKLYFPQVASKANIDPNKVQWVTVDGSTMASLLISGRIDAAPFLTTNWYYQNKQANKLGKKIITFPFSKQGFTIYGLTIFTTDDAINKRPAMLKNFLQASLESWKQAETDPTMTCKAHTKFNPEVDMDDCLGNLNATLKYVLNDYSKTHGWGAYVDDRVKTTYEAVSVAQELDPKWNPFEAIDTRFLP